MYKMEANSITTMCANASISTDTTATATVDSFHTLYDKWVLYAHLPHDTNWTIDSYKSILEFSRVEQSLALFEAIPNVMISNCMLFLMRNTIKPIWEDENNRQGGCFSFKVAIKDVGTVWREMCYSTIGETLSENSDFMKNVNGITISPKRNFCILKIWMQTCDFKTVESLQHIYGIYKKDALFKKHNLEY